MAGDEGFGACAVVRQAAPFAEKPFGFFAQGFGNVFEPWADHEAVVHPAQQIDPAFRGVHGDFDFLREVGIDESLGAALGEDLHEGFHRAEVGDVGDFAEVFAGELLVSQRAPAAGEAGVAPQERLGESAVFPERVPIGGVRLGGWLDFLRGQVGSQTFADAPRVHSIKEVAPHEAVAAPAENVHAGTAGHEQSHAFAVGVEEAFEQGLPLGVFVQFVEDGDGRLRAEPVQLQRLRQRRRPAQEPSPVIGIIPVEIGVAERAADGGFAHLPWPGNKGHLAVFLEMLLEDCGVKSEAFIHGAIFAGVVK